jgi:uncharacterized RDD family membrane protein YckC
MKYAGFWVRFWASLIDSLCVLIIQIPAFIMNASGAVGFGTLLSIATNWLYEALFTSGAWQATPGKKLLGLRVTDLDGNRISFMRATGRYFSKIVSALLFLIGYIMVGLTERKQGLHDMMAGTLVTRKTADGPAFTTGTQTPTDTTHPIQTSAAARATRWVMAGFDSNGRVIRLSFDDNNPKLDNVGLIIGRDAQACDLHISDSSISRRHARLCKKRGDLWVEDLESSNGTMLEHRPLSGEGLPMPTHGTITLGGVKLDIAKY